MAKAIKWQIPFASLSGTLYRIDIYAEGYSGDPIQLTAGESPFVTEEDSSEDFFAPIRTQTGSIQVCTRKPDGTMLTLDEILPANNIDHPVRLINLSNSNAIEWQGFLSCEAYSQNYTSIPENITLSVISVLEAMDSVEVELSENMAFKTVLGHICYAMRAIQTKSGMTLFNKMFLSSYCKNAMESTFFYNNVYFNTEEHISGDNITVEVHSISCKAILEQVAQFLGCCWREVGQNIWLEAVGKDSAFSFQSFATIATRYVNGGAWFTWLTASIVSDGISNFDWRGTDHKRDIRQGAKRVKVSAKLKDFELNLSLQECPVNNLVENPSARQSTWGEVHANTNETFYSLAEHKHMQATFVCDYTTDEIQEYDPETGSYTITVYRGVASAAFKNFVQSFPYLHTQFWENTPLLTRWYGISNPAIQSGTSHTEIDTYLTSFMTWFRDKDNNLQSGLMLYALPKQANNEVESNTFVFTNNMLPSNGKHIFKQRTAGIFSAASGFLRMNFETLACGTDGMMDGAVRNYPLTSMFVALQFGSKWAYKDGNTYKWSNSFQYIQVGLEGDWTNGKLKTKGNWDKSMGIDEADGLFIPITSSMTGVVSLHIFPLFTGMGDAYNWGSWIGSSEIFIMLLGTMDVEYVQPSSELKTDRSDNTYITETQQAFRDEIEISTDIATDAQNTKLATMLWNNNPRTPVKLIQIGGQAIRPEVDLLNRLASYYGAARQTLDLIVKHPTAAALPLLKLNGISPDTRKYVPLAESRDWREETCTLKCFEMP